MQGAKTQKTLRIELTVPKELCWRTDVILNGQCNLNAIFESVYVWQTPRERERKKKRKRGEREEGTERGRERGQREKERVERGQGVRKERGDRERERERDQFAKTLNVLNGVRVHQYSLAYRCVMHAKGPYAIYALGAVNEVNTKGDNLFDFRFVFLLTKSLLKGDLP